MLAQFIWPHSRRHSISLWGRIGRLGSRRLACEDLELGASGVSCDGDGVIEVNQFLRFVVARPVWQFAAVWITGARKVGPVGDDFFAERTICFLPYRSLTDVECAKDIFELS